MQLDPPPPYLKWQSSFWMDCAADQHGLSQPYSSVDGNIKLYSLVKALSDICPALKDTYIFVARRREFRAFSLNFSFSF